MIRPATPEDSAFVTAVGVATGMFPAEDTSVTDRMMADYFARHAAAGHVCLIDVDDDTGERVGMAYFDPTPATEGTWSLTMIAMDPSRQSQGRGARLMAHIEGSLRERGQRLLLVQTSGDPQYERTRAFYTKCGYEVTARVRDYYAPGYDMVMFRKDLAAGAGAGAGVGGAPGAPEARA